MSFVVISPLVQTGPRVVQHYLGRQLRAIYAGLPVSPAPDQFSELLRQLDRTTVDCRPA